MPHIVQALALFDSVTHGNVRAYDAARRAAGRLVTNPLHQLALVDSILAARARAYGVQS